MTDSTVAVTVACDLGQCHRCQRLILSLTEANGQKCQHHCHRPAVVNVLVHEEGPATVLATAPAALAGRAFEVVNDPRDYFISYRRTA